MPPSYDMIHACKKLALLNVWVHAGGTLPIIDLLEAELSLITDSFLLRDEPAPDWLPVSLTASASRPKEPSSGVSSISLAFAL
jgi:hypothetical protein